MLFGKGYLHKKIRSLPSKAAEKIIFILAFMTDIRTTDKMDYKVASLLEFISLLPNPFFLITKKMLSKMFDNEPRFSMQCIFYKGIYLRCMQASLYNLSYHRKG